MKKKVIYGTIMLGLAVLVLLALSWYRYWHPTALAAMLLLSVFVFFGALEIANARSSRTGQPSAFSVTSLALFLLALGSFHIKIEGIENLADKRLLGWIAGTILALSLVRIYGYLLLLENSKDFHSITLGFLDETPSERKKLVAVCIFRFVEWLLRCAVFIVIGLKIPLKLGKSPVELSMLSTCLCWSAGAFVLWDLIVLLLFLFVKFWLKCSKKAALPAIVSTTMPAIVSTTIWYNKSWAKWIFVVTDILIFVCAIVVGYMYRLASKNEVGSLSIGAPFLVLGIPLAVLLGLELLTLRQYHRQAVRNFLACIIGGS